MRPRFRVISSLVALAAAGLQRPPTHRDAPRRSPRSPGGSASHGDARPARRASAVSARVRRVERRVGPGQGPLLRCRATYVSIRWLQGCCSRATRPTSGTSPGSVSRYWGRRFCLLYTRAVKTSRLVAREAAAGSPRAEAPAGFTRSSVVLASLVVHPAPWDDGDTKRLHAWACAQLHSKYDPPSIVMRNAATMVFNRTAYGESAAASLGPDPPIAELLATRDRVTAPETATLLIAGDVTEAEAKSTDRICVRRLGPRQPAASPSDAFSPARVSPRVVPCWRKRRNADRGRDRGSGSGAR